MRLIWVDYAKAFGIMLVVYGHVARGLMQAGLPMDEAFFGKMDAIIYSFHMPLFFFLSGLFLGDSMLRRGCSGFLRSKVDVLIYPYLVWSIFQGLVEVGLNRWTNNHIGISDVLQLLWLPRAQFWFLYALFLISLFAMAADFFVKNRYVILLISLVLYFFGSGYVSDFRLMYICNFSVYFFIGTIFPKEVCPRGGAAWLWVVASLALCFAVYVALFFLQSSLSGRLAGLILALAGGGVVVSCGIWLSRWKIEGLAWIGAASMSIYLMHVLVAGGVRIFLVNVLGIDRVDIHLLAECGLGLLVPLLAMENAKRFGFSFLFVNPAAVGSKISTRSRLAGEGLG